MKKFLGLMFLFGCATASAQDPCEIYLFDVATADGKIALSNGRNITRRKGYDNQPHFHPSEPLIYYSSFDKDGRSDIKSYNYRTKKTEPVTTTDEREYSPTVTPDGKFISCIIQRDDGAQDLGKYPIGGRQPAILIDDLTVGYHAWVTESRLILFVLGETMTLRSYDLSAKSDTIIAHNIGRSLHKIPGDDAMSFVHKMSENEWMIKRLDNKTNKVAEIVHTLPGREDLTWTPDRKILMSDGKRVFVHDPKKQDNDSSAWRPISMGETQLSGITRLAMHPSGKRLAIVADEN